ISEFQAIQFKLADMATEVEAARLLVYQAAWLADQGKSRFTREASMAKLFASEVAVRVANECVQIHGGYGFIKDYPAEKFYRDVKLCTGTRFSIVITRTRPQNKNPGQGCAPTPPQPHTAAHRNAHPVTQFNPIYTPNCAFSNA
ncbi:acyl-CoA dehydrogenase family protein, partial [Pseudenterobacter timonensis]